MPGIDFSVHATNPIAQGPAAAVAKAKENSSSFGFDDLLDIVNPLQHIPVISTIYRHLTGDTIGTPEKIAGDTLYGGGTGLLCSLGDSLFQELTGKSVGDTVYAMVVGDDAPKTAIASAAPPSSETPASVAPASITPTSVMPAAVMPAAVTPISVTPASSVRIAMPDFSFLNALATDQPATIAETVQRATAAYRTAGRMIEAY